MKKHVNIPVFVPRLGCPNACVLCDQRRISGSEAFDEEHLREKIETVLSALPGGTDAELAFFGGSFTGIEHGLLLRLCRLGEEYVDSGRVSSLRCSTRPDYIDAGALELLKKSNFRTVELGVQSMDDRVLAVCRRGHTADCTKRACRLIRDAGLSLGCQMMVGLPGASPESEVETAEFIVASGASEARIYPTVVFPGTELERMVTDGAYTPLTEEEAVVRAADAAEILIRGDVRLLRIGLCEGEGLRSASAGPNSPDIGERVRALLFFRRASALLQALPAGSAEGKTALFQVGRGKSSQFLGHGRENAVRLVQNFGLSAVRVSERDALGNFDLSLTVI